MILHAEYEEAVKLELSGGDSAIILKHLQRAATDGSPQAQYALGVMYLHGQHVEVDNQKALDFLRDASDQMYPDALFDLGVALEIGKIVKKNKKEAFKCYFHAMIFGDRQAIQEVARCVYHGIGVEKNIHLYKMLMLADDFLKKGTLHNKNPE